MKLFFTKHLLFILFFLGNFSAKAQYLTIPDTNFSAYLHQMHSQCMIGNQLDTTCSDVLAAQAFYCNNLNIQDLTGISAFKNLIDLTCNGNQLTTLVNLPNSITQLNCRDNQITSISLPASLKYLNCENNLLSYLPTLPLGLINLNCDNNLLTSIPAIPSTLRLLNCRNNRYDNLPVLPNELTWLSCGHNNFWNPASPTLILPDSINYFDCEYIPGFAIDSNISILPNLEIFSCAGNNLGKLPVLPPNLKQLHCDDNNLDSLPDLPITLISITCGRNQLIELPILPPNLSFLNVGWNQIDSFPGLPNTIRVLDISANSFSTLPVLPDSLTNFTCWNCNLTELLGLPDTLMQLDIRNNPNLNCLPAVHLSHLFWDNTGVTCLPQTIAPVYSNPSVLGVPFCDIVNPNNCSAGWNISGRIYGDSIVNCLYDSVEGNFSNVKVNLLIGGSIYRQYVSDSKGDYYFDVPNGNYTYFPDTLGKPYTVNCPTFGPYNSTITSSNYFNDKNFSIQCKAGFDIGVLSVVHLTGVIRPGNIAHVQFMAGDLSHKYGLNCSSGQSGKIKVVFFGPVQYLTSSGSGLIPNVNGDTLEFIISDFGNLNMNTDLGMSFLVDTTAQLGDQICFQVIVDSLVGDNNFSNNYFLHCFDVVNSYDPNDKSVSPTSFLDSTQNWLTFTIRYQNTGNAPAQNVFILDTLSNLVDRSSFELLSSSHDPFIQINNNLVHFNFMNINLPDSFMNEPDSHGYVQYRVKRQSGLPVGTQIRNTAYIYFDFNPPIVTNTTVNEITAATTIGVNTVSGGFNLNLYPNPISSGSILNINTPSVNTGPAMVRIIEIGGRVVYSKDVNISGNTVQVDLPGISPGIYICELLLNGSGTRKKLVVTQ